MGSFALISTSFLQLFIKEPNIFMLSCFVSSQTFSDTEREAERLTCLCVFQIISEISKKVAQIQNGEYLLKKNNSTNIDKL